MPGKGHRVASHQARLNQRRRRQAHGPMGIPETPVATRVDTVEPPPGRPEPVPAPTAAAAPRTRAEYRPAALNFVDSELKRIGVFAGVALVLLIVLTLVLG